MASGTATCFAPISALVLDPIELPSRHKCVTKYAVETVRDNRLQVKYYFRDVDSRERVESVVAETIHEILDKIAFQFQVTIGEPYIRGYSITANHVDGLKEIVGVNLHVRCEAKCTLKPGPESIGRLRELLESDTPLVDGAISFFRFSLRQTNPVARFMLLYNILLSLNGDNQAKLDNFLISMKPQVEVKPSPHKKWKSSNLYETVYTRLRNEIGHARKGAVPRETAKEIESHISDFQSIVRNAILHLNGEGENKRKTEVRTCGT